MSTALHGVQDSHVWYNRCFAEPTAGIALKRHAALVSARHAEVCLLACHPPTHLNARSNFYMQ